MNPDTRRRLNFQRGHTECIYSRPGRKNQREALRFSVGRAEIISTLLQSRSAEYRTVRAYEPDGRCPGLPGHEGRRGHLFGEEHFEGSEEAKELPNVIPKCHKKPTVSEIVAHNRSRTPYPSSKLS